MYKTLCSVLVMLLLHITAFAVTPIKVVTTLTTFSDIVQTIGGEHVDVDHIASPKFNPHFIQARPSDVLRVKKATLFVHAGLDLELWRMPLLDAAGNRDLRPGGHGDVDLSVGVSLLEAPTRQQTRAEGDFHLYGNPHYWLSPDNVKILAATITEKLSAQAPEYKDEFERNRSNFVAELSKKILEWKQKLAPYTNSELIGYHNEWPYFMMFSGMKMKMFLEPKPGVPPTPKHLDSLMEYIAVKKIKGIIQSAYYPARASKSLSKRTGVAVIMLCQNVNENKDASSYIAMMDYNVQKIVNTLRN